jgi:hypothetical protein
MYTKDYTFILNEVKQFGFNTIRLPFSKQMWESDPIPSTHYTTTPAPAPPAVENTRAMW